MREKQGGQNVHPDKTAETLAKQHGVTDRTIRRDGKYGESVETATEVTPDLPWRITVLSMFDKAVTRRWLAFECKPTRCQAQSYIGSSSDITCRPYKLRQAHAEVAHGKTLLSNIDRSVKDEIPEHVYTTVRDGHAVHDMRIFSGGKTNIVVNPIIYPCCGGMPLGSKTVGLANGDYGFLVRGVDGKPVAMKSDSDNGNNGDPDPLCEDCPCSANLAENYLVTISGFPAVCNVGTFNGTWTVPWILDCIWQLDITAYHRLTLYFNGTSWDVLRRVTSPGGAYGHFIGTLSIDEVFIPATQLGAGDKNLY